MGKEKADASTSMTQVFELSNKNLKTATVKMLKVSLNTNLVKGRVYTFQKLSLKAARENDVLLIGKQQFK